MCDLTEVVGGCSALTLLPLLTAPNPVDSQDRLAKLGACRIVGDLVVGTAQDRYLAMGAKPVHSAYDVPASDGTLCLAPLIDLRGQLLYYFDRRSDRDSYVEIRLTASLTLGDTSTSIDAPIFSQRVNSTDVDVSLALLDLEFSNSNDAPWLSLPAPPSPVRPQLELVIWLEAFGSAAAGLNFHQPQGHLLDLSSLRYGFE